MLGAVSTSEEQCGGQRPPLTVVDGHTRHLSVCSSAPTSPAFHVVCPCVSRTSQENRREYERKVKEIVEQSWAADEEEGGQS